MTNNIPANPILCEIFAMFLGVYDAGAEQAYREFLTLDPVKDSYRREKLFVRAIVVPAINVSHDRRHPIRRRIRHS